MRKKVLSIVLALALMLTIAPATVFAAETITVTSDKAEVEVGQEFTLTVKLPDTGTFGGFEAFLNYDGDKVEYVSSAKGGLVKVGADFSDLANQPANNRVFALATIVDEGTWDFAQDFFTVTFKVKDGATGSVAPTFEISTYFDYDFNDIEYTVDMAAVTVKAGETPHTHTLVKTDEVPATCTAEGTKAYWTCSDCGKMFSDEAGTAEITAPEKIAKLDHTWGEWTETKPATETEEGEEERTCSVCGEKETRTIPKLDHVHTLVKTDEVPATCAAEGTKAYWTCSACGKMFSDEEGKNEITAPEKIAALGHTWGPWTTVKEATKDEDGEEERVCSVCGEKETRTVKYEDPAIYDGGESTFYEVDVLDANGGNVKANRKTASRWGKVTVTMTPDEGYEVDELVVTDRKGNEVKVTDQGDGKFVFTMPASNVTVDGSFKKTVAPVVDEENPFTDVDPDDYFYDAVIWAAENGVTSGTSEDTFSPSVPCNRAQFVTFLWRAAGKPTATVMNPFDDVAEGQYYTEAVLWAVENGVTNGTGEGTFSPDATLTRGQVVTFLYRYCNGVNNASANPFEDVAADDWFYDAVLWAVEEGITKGVSETSFAPNALCDRGQTVTFLSRVFAD